MAGRGSRLLKWWNETRHTSGFRNIMLYLSFACIAFLFWLLMTLNDNMQDTITVDIKIVNVPDSVVFINDPPQSMSISIKDKGTNLLRKGWLKTPELQINFKEYARDGVLRYSSKDIFNALRREFGANAVVSSVSIDSLQLWYTSGPGKKVPVNVVYDIEPAIGNTLSSPPSCAPGTVTIYSAGDMADTISRINTKLIRLQNIKEGRKMKVAFQTIPGVKIVPSEAEVTVNIESLVKKNVRVPISVVGVPAEHEVELTPNNVEVSFIVPMSRLDNDYAKNIELFVDYKDVESSTSRNVPVRIKSYPKEVMSGVRLASDSVYYTVK